MIPFIDLAAQQQRIRPQIDSAIARVLDHGKYIMGPEVAQLESDLCQFSGAKHCISVSNGTDALIAALQAYGVGPGDAIITTPFTFFATVEAIMFVGATPVFCDIDPDTMSLCPQLFEKVVNETIAEGQLNLRGVIPVCLFGLCADYAAINRVAEQNDMFVLQDSAQAFGASTPDGRRAPTHGHVGTTSFFPAKPLGCYGDGGAVFTDDDELAARLRSIRVHGKGKDKYDNVRVGQNCRLDTLQAGILIEKLKIYQDELDARQRVATAYSEAFELLNQRRGEQLIGVPAIPEGYTSAWAQYTVRTPNREALSAALKEHGIPSLVYYRTSSHLLGACAHFGYQEGDFPQSELASRSVLSLPFHPYLNMETVADVVAKVDQSIERLTV